MRYGRYSHSCASGTGHDFTNYKRPTLLRRIERRINVRGLHDLVSYAAYIQQNPDETTALLHDLLISVTNFFRDKKAFEAVETEVLPDIIRNKGPEEQVRIWVAGCATGEEAYSMAMLCAEQTLSIIDAPKVQIFATDIDEAAIAHAREGLYTINDAADVSPERLRRFFNKEGEGYRIRREIREMILFANHNFIKDPPFSHLDVVTCRNVLIYLNHTAQERVMETFHFALNPGGYLFLGSSESADGANDLYSTFNREHHIFQKRQIATMRSYPVPESVPTFRFEQTQQAAKSLDQTVQKHERITYGELHQRMLEQYAPPSLIVNEEYDIVHLTERAGRYLQLGGGEPSQNLLKLVRQELRLELRSALYQAVQRQTAVDARNLKVKVDDRTETIDIHVRPVLHQGDIAHGFILVVFERMADEAANNKVVLSSDEPVARQLEEELMRLKAQLRASNEQHELNAEELKASNEELQAMNEELRSAAEELETSKEELQSINEELRTVNQELKVKVEETTLASNNLHNLINSVDIGTIFLDRSLRVAFFTPAARELFNLIPADFGRPLSDITSRLAYDHFITDAETVMEKLHSVEREVCTTDNRVFMMRILPYRTAEDRINGVVVTFIDISKRKGIEEALRTSEENMRLLIESAKDYAIFRLDTERNVNSWNTGAEAMMGYTEQEIIGLPGDIIFVPEDREQNAPEQETQKAAEEGMAENERWHLRKDGSRFWGSGTVRPIYDKGNLTGFVKIMRDLTERKMLEQLKDDFIGVASHELRTPITSIKSYTELLSELLENDKSASTFIAKLNKQIDRLAVLVADLLDVTSIKEGQLRLHEEEFDINELVKESAEELQPIFASHKIHTELADTAPVYADRERVGQVLKNLISNAVKYSPGAEKIIVITLQEKNAVIVKVQDFGIGVPENMRQRVFERFFRLANTNQGKATSLGLGLYIAANIIQRHHGRIWVEDNKGPGATFCFSLPLIGKG